MKKKRWKPKEIISPASTRRGQRVLFFCLTFVLGLGDTAQRTHCAAESWAALAMMQLVDINIASPVTLPTHAAANFK